MNPKISIIVPCYNSYSKMERCLKAFEGQSYKNFEVIFVDDCSTDNTCEQLNAWIHKSNVQSKLIRQESNSGPGIARNRGIQEAQGEFVCFCDADDWYEDNYLEAMYNEIKLVQADLVMCNYRQVLKDGKQRDIRYLKSTSLYEKRDYLVMSKFSLCLLMVKTDIMKSICLPNLYNGEDMAVVPLIILASNRIAHIKNILYNYYFHTDSASNLKSQKIYYSLIDAFLYLKKYWAEKGFQEELELLGIKEVLYGAVLNGIKANISQKEIKNTIDMFREEFPRWWKNKYYTFLSFRYRVFLKLCKNKCFIGMKIFSAGHSIVSVK